MARAPVVLALDPDQRDEVLEAMAQIDAAGRGWVNLSPDVDPQDLPPGPGPFAVFSPFGPPVPLCTWTPPDRGKQAPHAVVGVQHGRGARLAPSLPELGAALREGWRVVQDQPKKGLVVSVPGAEDRDVILRWLIAVGGALCPLPYPRWVATIYR